MRLTEEGDGVFANLLVLAASTVPSRNLLLPLCVVEVAVDSD
jgi:hypothetical protein